MVTVNRLSIPAVAVARIQVFLKRAERAIDEYISLFFEYDIVCVKSDQRKGS